MFVGIKLLRCLSVERKLLSCYDLHIICLNLIVSFVLIFFKKKSHSLDAGLAPIFEGQGIPWSCLVQEVFLAKQTEIEFEGYLVLCVKVVQRLRYVNLIFIILTRSVLFDLLFLLLLLFLLMIAWLIDWCGSLFLLEGWDRYWNLRMMSFKSSL